MTATWDGEWLTFNRKIDEFLDVPKTPASKVKADFGAVEEINSSGIRKLMQWITSRGEAPTEFHKCPRILVDNFNTIPHLTGKPPHPERVISFYAPYVCTDCEAPDEGLITTANLDLAADDIDFPRRACEHCGRAAVLDGDPIEYLAFLLDRPDAD